jgi:hypothetical protein
LFGFLENREESGILIYNFLFGIEYFPFGVGALWNKCGLMNLELWKKYWFLTSP